MKQKLWSFQWEFGLSEALCIAIDFHGFELLYHLRLASNNLFHPTCLLNFLFHLVFQDTNPMKQLLSYKYTCLAPISQVSFTESHVNNSASYYLHHIFLYSNPKLFPSKPGTKSLRLQRNNVLILIQTSKISKKHISVGVKEFCFSQEALSLTVNWIYQEKPLWSIFNGKTSMKKHPKSLISIENLKPLGKSSLKEQFPWMMVCRPLGSHPDTGEGISTN